MIRVVHVITGLFTGGAETMLFKLLSRTDRDRFHPAVVSLKSGGPMAEKIRGLGVEVYSAGLERRLPSPRKWMRLAKLVDDLEPNILQGWMIYGNLAAQMLSAGSGRRPRVLWNMRNSLHDLRVERRTTAGVVRAMARLSGLPVSILYNSRTSARQHEARGYDARKTRVIPNGFDGRLFRPDEEARRRLRGELGVRERTPLVGLIARFHPVKDHLNFLRAARLLVSAGSPARFVMAGRGTDGAEAGALVDRLQLRDRVQALGERDDLPPLTAALDIATCCSVAESFPNAVGEAMACGVPCVVTDVGDAQWMIGPAGRVVAPRDSAALADAWRTLLALPPGRKRAIGEAGRARVLEKFSLDRVVGQYESLYAEVAHG